MSLISFHRFLIATAIVFCLGFGYRELTNYLATGALGSLVIGVCFGVAGLVLGYYLKNLARFLGTSGEGVGPSQGAGRSFSPNGHKAPKSEPLSDQ